MDSNLPYFPPNNVFDKVYLALSLLYETCKERQSIYRHTFYHDNSAWLNEFCTIRMSSGRRSGHSYSIVRLIVDRGLDSIVLFPQEKQIISFEGIFPSLYPDYDYRNKVFLSTIDQVVKISGKKFNSIFVDCATYALNGKREKDLKNIILSSKFDLMKEDFFLFLIE